MKYFLVALVFGNVIMCFSQKANESVINLGRPLERESSLIIDSLKKELASVNEDQRFEIQYDLFREYLPINKDSAAFYIDKSLNLAKLSGDSLRIVRALYSKAGVLQRTGNLVDATTLYKNSLQIAKRNGFERQVKYILNFLAILYTSNASYDIALDYNFESLSCELRF